MCTASVFYMPLWFTIPLMGLHHRAYVQDCIEWHFADKLDVAARCLWGKV